MFATGDRLDAYLNRIGLTHAVACSEAGLAELHAAHGCAIAFENLDILLGRGVSLHPEDVFAKLVTRRRGGYCFEQNALFGAALAALGFEVRPLLARVWFGGVTEPREKTHQLLLVTLNGRPWLADVGFGTAGALLPMPMEAGFISRQPGRDYRLSRDAVFGFMLERSIGQGPWEKLYSFDLELCWPADFEMGSFYMAHAPQSPFTSRVVCSLQTPGGWRVLVDHDLMEVEDGETRTQVIEPGPAYMEMLRQRFDLDPGEPYEALRVLSAADAA